MVDNAADVITEEDSEGTDLVQVAIATAGGTYALGENVENATLTNTVAFNLTGNDANNVLKGNAANNVIDGGAGADSMDGGAGNDTYVVDDAGDSITDSAGIDTVRTQLAYTLSGVLENLTLTGSDAVAGTGNSLANILDGSQNSAANLLTGLAGNDTYIVGAGDTVVEAANGGTDLVKSYADFELGANLENLSLLGSDDIDATGNSLANVITGNLGANILDGGAAKDSLAGGKGDDTYRVDLTSTNLIEDTITENASEGIDTVELRGGNAALAAITTLTLGANLENLDASATGLTKLNLTGNALNNTLTGNDAANILNGGAGNDTLVGGLGNDTLIGGTGVDFLGGGDGNDIFRFAALSDLGLGATQDVIEDFLNGEDKLDFSALGGYRLVGAIDNTADFTATKQLGYMVDGDDLILYGNSGGGTEADFSIKLLGVAELSRGDFTGLLS